MNSYKEAAKKRPSPHGALPYLEFHLPPRPAQYVIDLAEDSEDNQSQTGNTNTDSHNIDTDNDDNHTDAFVSDTDPRIGSLPPSFAWPSPSSKEPASTTPSKIPMTQVKMEAATHSLDDRQVVHIYLQVSIDIKPDAPDWPGLMKVYDFLHFRVGPNATILILPSRRRSGDENPILTRWTKATNRSIYPVYFQGYVIPKTPTSTAADKKKAKTKQNATTTSGDMATTVELKGHTLNLRTCVSLYKFQIETLAKAASALQDQHMRLTIDPIRAEYVDKIGWLTGTHKFMNTAHWRHFIHTQLLAIAGSTYELRLQMDALTPPRSVTGNERYRQTHPKKGTDPIQMWGIYAARQSYAGLSSALHSLFHTNWQGKVFGQDMQFLPLSIGDSPDGLATMWTAAKTWQDSTYVVKSFGLRPIHDLILLHDQESEGRTPQTEPHSLAYYCRQIHQPGGPPLFRAVEERDPTPSDILIHGTNPVVYFLIHKDNFRVAEQFAADVYNALAYTVNSLQPEHVYILGSDYVPIAATKAMVDAEAAEALAALNLRINGTPDTTTKQTNPGSAVSTKTTASNPLDTPVTSPQRTSKKPRVFGSSIPYDSSSDPRDSTTAVSSLTASEHQRIRELEEQVQDLLESDRAFSNPRLQALEAQLQRMEDAYQRPSTTLEEFSGMLRRTMMEMFPSQAHFTSALFQDYDMSDLPLDNNTNLPPIIPPPHNPPGTSHEMMDTDNNSQDEYHSAKQAEMDGDE
jgi:hypothetical protein